MSTTAGKDSARKARGDMMAWRACARVLAAATALAVAGAPAAAWSQSYPDKPITVVVPTGAGGSTDVIARLMAPRMGELLGQPVVVVNKAGAGGVIGAQAVASAPPDGYTLMISTNQLAMVPNLFKKAPYDAIRDFAPITSLALVPIVVVANPKLPISSMKDLVEYAKRNPGTLTYGSAGNGSPNHLFAELLNRTAGIQITHVPYKGIAAAANDVVAGHLSIAFVSLVSVQGLIDTGKLKLLAVTSAERLTTHPNIPTIGESVPGYDAGVWVGLWSVAHTPAPIIQKIHNAAVQTLSDPAIVNRLLTGGMVVQTRTPAAFDALTRSELERWGKLIDSLGDAIEKE